MVSESGISEAGDEEGKGQFSDFLVVYVAFDSSQ